jgi:predicted PilT family ATPase
VIDVPKKYIGMIIGKGGNNKEKIETKSGTQIKVLSRHDARGTL